MIIHDELRSNNYLPQSAQRGIAATKGKTNYIPPTVSLPLGGGRVGRE